MNLIVLALNQCTLSCKNEFLLMKELAFVKHASIWFLLTASELLILSAKACCVVPAETASQVHKMCVFCDETVTCDLNVECSVLFSESPRKHKLRFLTAIPFFPGPVELSAEIFFMMLKIETYYNVLKRTETCYSYEVAKLQSRK